MILFVSAVLVFFDIFLNNEKEYVNVEVRHGDSVWSIASEWAPKSDYKTKDMVKWIIDNNNKIDPMIYPGEILVIPVEAEKDSVHLAAD